MLNTVQKQILADSSLMEEHSNGTVRFTYAKNGCSIIWTLYVDGEKQAEMHTDNARSFMRGYRLATKNFSVAALN